MGKAKILLAALLAVCVAYPSCAAASSSTAQTVKAKQQTKTKAKTKADEAQALFDAAFAAYRAGKLTDNPGIRSEKYAAAISAISRAAKLDKYNSDILALASSIYRAKGGASMAKKYFSMAEDTLLTRLYDEPNDIGANLDYAILCYAGEPRFGDKYKKYLKTAGEYADTVISLAKKPVQNGSAPCARAMGFAYLIKGDAEKCGELLKIAAKTDTSSKFYRDLFDDTVAKGRWLWPVGKDAAAKEFLLYSMTDPARYSKLPSPEKGSWIEVSFGKSFGL